MTFTDNFGHLLQPTNAISHQTASIFHTAGFTAYVMLIFLNVNGLFNCARGLLFQTVLVAHYLCLTAYLLNFAYCISVIWLFQSL